MTSSENISLEDKQALIKRILASPHFSARKALSKKLSILTDAEMNGEGEKLTERYLAEKLAGGDQILEGKLAETGSLRTDLTDIRDRLAAYRATEGKDDN